MSKDNSLLDHLYRCLFSVVHMLLTLNVAIGSVPGRAVVEQDLSKQFPTGPLCMQHTRHVI